MSLGEADIRRLARLARIGIDAATARDVQAKREATLGLIDELKAIDTTDVEPMAHAQDVVLPLRDDVVTAHDEHAAFQRVAPAAENGLYLVPKVIE
jgi:aspartyl-tRNA(Asn)/glutamyl-tRNA(Gln) amidotransferase subunit C